MKQPSSQRRQAWVRVAVYSVMTTSVVVIVALLMLVVLGYSFNQRDGKLEQGGLLQFASIPTGASVTLDELTLSSRTNTKATVATGSHSVSFDRSGYRTWKKTIAIAAGQVGWVNYARLIPTTLTPTSMRTFTSLSSSLASPKHNFLLLHEAADSTTFELADIQGDTVKYTTLTLPAGSYTVPAEGTSQSFTLQAWSYNEDAILIKHSVGDQAEWIVLDRQDPAKSMNINTVFGVAPSKVVFAGEGSRQLFVQTDDIVRRVNLDDETLSRQLIAKVDNFDVYDEKTIIYATTAGDDGKRTVGYAATDIAQPITIRSYPADGQLLLASMETYFNKRYVSVLHGQDLVIHSGDLPTTSGKGSLVLYAQVTVPSGVTQLAMSDTGRFVTVQVPGGFATYDIELKKYDATTWAYPAATERPLQWLDEYILWNDNAGQARIYDFDGANQQTIMQTVEGQVVSITNNDKYFYGITKSDKGVDLSRVRLILD